MRMFEAQTGTTDVPSVGSDSIGALVQCPDGEQPFAVYLRNNGSFNVYIAHDVSVLRDGVTLGAAFELKPNDWLITVVAPGQKLLAACATPNSENISRVTYLTFALPFFLGGISGK